MSLVHRCDLQGMCSPHQLRSDFRAQSQLQDEERRELDDWLRWVADYAERLDPR
jgi:hypothetical protein